MMNHLRVRSISKFVLQDIYLQYIQPVAQHTGPIFSGDDARRDQTERSDPIKQAWLYNDSKFSSCNFQIWYDKVIHSTLLLHPIDCLTLWSSYWLDHSLLRAQCTYWKLLRGTFLDFLGLDFLRLPSWAMLECNDFHCTNCTRSAVLTDMMVVVLIPLFSSSDLAIFGGYPWQRIKVLPYLGPEGEYQQPLRVKVLFLQGLCVLCVVWLHLDLFEPWAGLSYLTCLLGQKIASNCNSSVSINSDYCLASAQCLRFADKKASTPQISSSPLRIDIRNLYQWKKDR